MKRKVKKDVVIKTFRLDEFEFDIEDFIKILSEIKAKASPEFDKIKIGVENSWGEITIEISGDEKESVADFKKRLLAQEKRERKQYEKLKRKFEAKNWD